MLQDLEARPVVNTASPLSGTQGALTLNGTPYAGTSSGTSGGISQPSTATTLSGAVTADGTTSTSYSITGATPNALITVATTLGTLTSTDGVGGSSYTGIQVLVSFFTECPRGLAVCLTRDFGAILMDLNPGN